MAQGQGVEVGEANHGRVWGLIVSLGEEALGDERGNGKEVAKAVVSCSILRGNEA